MPLKTHVNLDGFMEKTSPGNIKLAQYALVNQVMSDMEQFVPKEQNHLRDSAHLNSSGDSIVYAMPYAKAQFYGMIGSSRIHNYTTPGTSRRWDLRAKSMFISDWMDVFKKGMMK
ncbi:minor capsid protein [Lactiplantibacillus pingfangensis]|uniref:minor capsid protein n=1 Tax=Lactiplantibacillus TaxID=2767842 RepID=UPI0010F717FA|nr:minor capsid protein [Lactiplantibacillus pingfangensis]